MNKNFTLVSAGEIVLPNLAFAGIYIFYLIYFLPSLKPSGPLSQEFLGQTESNQKALELLENLCL